MFKAPKGIYYMRETAAPEGYDDNPNVYLVLVGEAALDPSSWSSEDTSGVLSEIGSAQIEAQTGTGENAKPYAIFLIDSATGKATATPDIANHGIANYSEAKQHVILKKVNGGNAPLQGAVFEILRHDRTLVSGVDINGEATTRFTSGTNGEYFVGTLPYGTYDLHEVVVPSSVSQNGSEGWWYTLTVNESGVSLGERRPTE